MVAEPPSLENLHIRWLLCDPLYSSVNAVAGTRFLRKTREIATFAGFILTYSSPKIIMKVMLDLFSGLGGASEAFVQDGWRVIRVEINPELAYVPHTLTLDCLDWADWIDNLPPVDLIWASPPCDEFSLAFNAPAAIAQREGRDFHPDMKCVKAAMDIIDALKPRHWVIENVQGSIAHLQPLMGKCTQKIGAYYLWGNFPMLIMPDSYDPVSKTSLWGATNKQERALIPFELSFALLKAIREQTYIEDWC